MTMPLAEIPQIKLAKVGREEREKERKKAGLAWWLRGGRSASDLLRGGAGSVSGWLRALARLLQTLGLGEIPLASLLSKTLIALLLGAACVAAYNFGQTLSGDDASKNQAQKLFAPHEGGSTSGIASAGAAQSGLGMISGSLSDGADKAAADKAPDKAAGDGTKEAPDAQAAGKTDGAGDGADAAGKARSGFGQKFGQLSNGLGSGHSGLAGGAGMSSGVGRAFDKMGMAKAIGSATAPTRSKAPQAIRGRKGKAFNQLKGANASSRQGSAATTAEAAATPADAAFSNNKPIGTLITSPADHPLGANTGGAGAGDSGPTPNPTSGSETNNPGTTTAPDTGHADVTPWKGKMKMAAMLLAVGCMLLLAAAACAYMGWGGKMLATILGGLAAMCGAIVVALGMGIAKYGGGASAVGKMFEMSGAVLTAGGAIVAIAPQIAKEGASMTVPAIVGALASIMSGLLGAKAYKMGAHFN